MARLAVQAFDGIRFARRENQVLALAGAFALLCEVLKTQPQDAFTVVRNLMVDRTHPDQIKHQFAGLRHYIETELSPGA